MVFSRRQMPFVPFGGRGEGELHDVNVYRFTILLLLFLFGRRRRVFAAQRTRAVPGRVRQHLGQLQVFVPRHTGHQAVRRRAHVRRRGRVPGRDGRVFAPVHQHGRVCVLRVPGRPAAGRRLEDVRGRGRVFGPGNATVAGPVRGPRLAVHQHVRVVRVRVSACDAGP